MSGLKGTKITWLGHATVLLETARGTTILIDPFIEHNPKYPRDYVLPEKLDLLLLTHGHSDHTADAVPLVQRYSPTVVAIVELAGWIAGKGAEKAVGMNLGGSHAFGDVTLTLVEAKHSSSIEEDGRLLNVGPPAGFILSIDGGPILYHAGDTSVFSDMRLIGELYHPALAMLPIGDFYTMGPKAGALAAQYLGVKQVLPIHYGTFPALTGTPSQLRAALEGTGIEVLDATPGQTLS